MEKNTITKKQTAKIETKNGKSYSYQYVDIAQIHEYLESIGASYYQFIDRIDGDDYIMTVKIINGQEQPPLRGSRVVDATLMGNTNPAQIQGSALTYARRYSLLMAFGLATEDDDAQALTQTKDIKLTLEEARNYVITFGKKHPNEKLEDIMKKDKGYLDWLLENKNTDEIIKQAIKLIYADNGIEILNDEEQQEKLVLMTRVNELLIETKIDLEKILKHYNVSSTTDMTIGQLKEVIVKMESKLS